MQIAEGDIVLSLDERDKDIFYEVTKVKPDNSGATWITLVGKTTKKETGIPLIYLEKSYMKVSKTTARILFGSKDESKNSKG